MRSMYKASTTLAAILLVAGIAGTVQLAAHHGWTGYEGSKETTLTGTIKTFSYENPHASVDLDVNGKVWKVILAPPTRMQSRGLQRDTLKVGTRATVLGYVHKNVPTELRAERITIADKVTELR
jgi:Family of unknown function (DUF6152)